MATSNAEAVATPKFLLTPPGILSFPQLFTAKAPVPGSEPRFSTVILFDEAAQKTPEYAALKQALVDCAHAEFGVKVDLKSLKFPLRDGAEKDYQGYGAGKKFLSAWSKNKPGILDSKLDAVTDPNALWAGQIARLSITPFAYNTSGNKGISLGLRHVQILRMDMPRLDGRGSAESDFGKAALPAGYEAEERETEDANSPF